jgi:hypothetical protein
MIAKNLLFSALIIACPALAVESSLVRSDAIGIDVPAGRVAYKSLAELGAGAKSALGKNLPGRSGQVGALTQADEKVTSALDAMEVLLKPDNESLSRATFTPARLSGTLAEMSLRGVLPEMASAKGGWTMISRLFAAGPAKVMLMEWDYRHEGGGVLSISDFHNVSVGSVPGNMRCEVSPQRKSLCTISWTTSARSYILYLQEPTFQLDAFERLRNLAEMVREVAG